MPKKEMIGARARGRVRRVARVTKHATPLSLLLTPLPPPTGSSPAHTTPIQDPGSDRKGGRGSGMAGMAADARKNRP